MIKPGRTPGVVLLALVLAFAFWWVVASDYSDTVASGTYHFGQSGVMSTLVLKPDHTFQQELTRAGTTDRAMGTWRVLGQGGISFSKEFLAVPGEEIEPDGTSFADIHKPLGLLVNLQMRQYHVLWYGRHDTSQDNSPSGTYVGDEEGAPATLTLNHDQTFSQDVIHLGVPKHAEGTWSFGKNGEIIFSSAFLKTSGEALQENESAIAGNPEGSNLQIVIAASSDSGVPTFHKHQLLW
jgi:hypothetical protein